MFFKNYNKLSARSYGNGQGKRHECPSSNPSRLQTNQSYTLQPIKLSQ